MEMPKHKHHLFVDESIWLGEEGLEETKIPGEVEEQCGTGGKEDFDKYGNVEMHEVFSRHHNGLLGCGVSPLVVTKQTKPDVLPESNYSTVIRKRMNIYNTD